MSYLDGIIPTTPLPKVIAATLDMVPHERTWREDEFKEWLEMFEGACRVWYRLPRTRKPRQSPLAGEGGEESGEAGLEPGDLA